MLSTLLILFVGVAWAVPNESNTKILFYPNDTMVSYDLEQAENIYENFDFISSRPTVLYLHGYKTNTDGNTTKLVIQAYRINKSFNILTLDWRELVNGGYTDAVSIVEKIAVEVAKFIQKMTGKGYSINHWHIVGHSLGAQLAGNVGRQIQSLSNGSLKLPRISALDPAGPKFYGIAVSSIKYINKDDATFIDVIHTNAGVLGAPVNTGTVDFWPNGGSFQPGCNFNLECSHLRAIDFWIESVENQGKVVFTSAYETDPNIKAQMGLDCSSNSQPGRYNLKTNSKPPYSLG